MAPLAAPAAAQRSISAFFRLAPATSAPAEPPLAPQTQDGRTPKGEDVDEEVNGPRNALKAAVGEPAEAEEGEAEEKDAAETTIAMAAASPVASRAPFAMDEEDVDDDELKESCGDAPEDEEEEEAAAPTSEATEEEEAAAAAAEAARDPAASPEWSRPRAVESRTYRRRRRRDDRGCDGEAEENQGTTSTQPSPSDAPAPAPTAGDGDSPNQGVKRARSASATEQAGPSAAAPPCSGNGGGGGGSGGAMKQLFLDLGQKNFGHVKCGVCGLLYARGEAADERTHAAYHAQAVAAAGMTVVAGGSAQAGPGGGGGGGGGGGRAGASSAAAAANAVVVGGGIHCPRGWGLEGAVWTCPGGDRWVVCVAAGDPPWRWSRARAVAAAVEAGAYTRSLFSST